MIMMAETVKKSRIVSAEDNLEESLMEEFNMRLKNCLSQDPLDNAEPPQQQQQENLYENIETVKNFESSKTSPATITKSFIQTERLEEILNTSNTISNGHHESSKSEIIYENLKTTISNTTSSEYVDMDSVVSEKQEAIYEDLKTTEDVDARTKPSFTTLLTAASVDTPDVKSVKDRMLLSTDATPTLFFTQTVTSPMLTPSEENVDFLKGFRGDSTSADSSPKDGSRSEETPKMGLEDDDVEVLVGDGVPVAEMEDVEDLASPPPAEKYVDHVENIYENLETMNVTVYEIGDGIKPATFCFNNSEEPSEAVSEPLSEDAQEDIVSQIEQRKTSDFGEDDDVTEISDVYSLDKQVSDSDSSNVVLDSSFRTEDPRRTDRFGVIQDFINSDTTTVCDDPEEVVGGEAQGQLDQPQKTGYNNAEVIEYIAMTEEPNIKVAPGVLDLPKPDERGDGQEEVEDDESDDPFHEVRTPGQTRIVDEIVKNYVSAKADSGVKNREKDTETVPPKIVQNLTSQFMKGGDEKDDSLGKSKKHDANQLKSVDIMKQINKFEHKDETLEKSSFSKFDALQKKNVLHIRSSDSTKAQEKFNGTSVDTTVCKSCGKQVFQMEQIKAEKAVWHKNCFRCHECNKQLNVDTYESHEGTLYCKPHFKALFIPKAVDDTDEPPKQKKTEVIIRENQPVELPPDVVRASDKPDLGLEELQSLNVKERFQVFEQHQSSDSTLERTHVNVKRSPSILSKLARFQSKGMDIGVTDEALNGIPIEQSSSDEEEEDIPDGEDAELVRAKRVQKEKPFHFTAMSDVKNKFEHGDSNGRDERREERKQEIQSIRNKLFMGKQGKMKEAYQEAVMKSESTVNLRKEEIQVCDTKTIKERFEKGEIVQEGGKDGRDEEEQEVYESEISKKSRSLFLQLDANASKAPQLTTVAPKLEVRKAREAYILKSASQDTVKCTEQIDDITVETADIQQRFKFFETYREPEKKRKQFRITPPREGTVKGTTPEREVYHDPDIVRADEVIEDSGIAEKAHTATKMLSKFRQMQENIQKEPVSQGPKPLKSFTPPPEPAREDKSSEEEASESEEEDEVDQINSQKLNDEDLEQAKSAAIPKKMRAKFERWQQAEIAREQANQFTINEEEQSQIESTKSLRQRFESMRDSQNETNKQPKIKVNRFVELSNIVEYCEGCEKKVYPLEKISVHGRLFHRSCFKCKECNTVLRMDSYTYNQGRLYCTPHFKRLFITKGNYDSAFGFEGHKEKWNSAVA